MSQRFRAFCLFVGVASAGVASVLAALSVIAASSQAQIRVNPTAAPSGASVSGSGSGFSPSGSVVQVHFGSANGPVLWSGTPAGDGTIVFGFAVPQASPGNHPIAATQTNHGGHPVHGTPAQAPFQVSQAPPTSATASASAAPTGTAATAANTAPTASAAAKGQGGEHHGQGSGRQGSGTTSDPAAASSSPSSAPDVQPAPLTDSSTGAAEAPATAAAGPMGGQQLAPSPALADRGRPPQITPPRADPATEAGVGTTLPPPPPPGGDQVALLPLALDCAAVLLSVVATGFVLRRQTEARLQAVPSAG